MIAIHDLEIKNMIRMAMDACDRAYVPYSGFRVGACIKTHTGAYYLGCNIENASFGATNCAERTALFKAVYEGEREFEALAIVSDSSNYTVPCGICRQALSEFCEPDMPVICANNEGKYKVFTFGDMLPYSFKASDMRE